MIRVRPESLPSQLRISCDGRSVRIVNERSTSRTCSLCDALGGPIGANGLRLRTWICSGSGARHDRGVNAARKILTAEGLPPSVYGNETSQRHAPPNRAHRPRNARNARGTGAHARRCSCPDYDVTRSSNRLWKALLARGIAVPDPLRLGICTAAGGTLLARDGTVSQRVFNVGPMLRADHWEATAVAELRIHAQQLAEHLFSRWHGGKADALSAGQSCTA